MLRKFEAQVGTTVHRYILQKRLLNAKQLLAGGLAPSEVCTYCGFGDYANFYRAFKAEYNQTPRQYVQVCVGKVQKTVVIGIIAYPANGYNRRFCENFGRQCSSRAAPLHVRSSFHFPFATK